MSETSMRAVVEQVAELLGEVDLRTTLSDLEQDLTRADLATAQRAGAVLGIDEDLLISAMRARRHLGQVNDVVHATAILLSLPTLLGPDEVIQRPPSLSAADDRTRRFDLETNHRLAEFRLAVWNGADAGRQRGVVKDFVHLALHDSSDERRRQLFVVGNRPITFLRTTQRQLRWAVDRGSRVATDLTQAGVRAEAPISQFVRRHAERVELVDLCEVVPEVGHTIEVIGSETVSSDAL